MFKLAVCNDWYDKKSAVFFNKDGFLRSLDVLKKEHGWDVVFFKKHEETFIFEHDYVPLHFSPNVKKSILSWKPDAILFFCDLSRPIMKEFEDVDIPKAIAFTGGTFNDYAHVPDIIFVESQSYYDRFKKDGRNVMRAFGTNLEVFKPIQQPKVFDTFFPATFAGWKRHALYAEATSKFTSLAAGWWQEHEPHCWEECQAYGVALLHHQSAESVNLLYSMSRTVVITSETIGGSQRAVLEAIACNVPVIVMGDSDKTSEYVNQAFDDGYEVGAVVAPEVEPIRTAVEYWMDKEVNGREWIQKTYSEQIYAAQIKEGIEQICSTSKKK